MRKRCLSPTRLSAWRFEVPWQELLQAVLWMTVGDPLKSGFQVCERIDAVDLCRFNQGCDAAPGRPTFIMTGEECVFAVECDGAAAGR